MNEKETENPEGFDYHENPRATPRLLGRVSAVITALYLTATHWNMCFVRE